MATNRKGLVGWTRRSIREYDGIQQMPTLDLHLSVRIIQAQTRALTLRILFENNRAVGVEYQLGNEIKRAGARKGVIIAAGAINTPQLLNLSGIGNAVDLEKLGIPVEVHLPGVGYNLQDHMSVAFMQVCSIYQGIPESAMQS